MGAKVYTLAGSTKHLCGKLTGVKDVYEVQCNLETADHIRIEQPENFLSLCEVKVYGNPSKCTIQSNTCILVIRQNKPIKEICSAIFKFP